jgi:hypothetical protein
MGGEARFGGEEAVLTVDDGNGHAVCLRGEFGHCEEFGARERAN